MAYVPEKPVWVSPVYEIERHDPVMGGYLGVNNVQARQLACRTRFILDVFLTAHNADGTHTLTDADLRETAAILESKLNLPWNTADLYEEYSALMTLLAQLNTALDRIEGHSGTPLKYIYEAMLLSWYYGYPRFAFDTFIQKFSLRDNFVDVPLIETINGDDSIDVIDSASVDLNEHYVIWDKDTNECRQVTVKNVLTKNRVILWETENKTRRHSGVLTKFPWEVHNGKAHATSGAAYITGACSVLRDFSRGNLLVAHETQANFSVYSHEVGNANPLLWVPCPKLETRVSSITGLHLSIFEVPGGVHVFKIVPEENVVIDHVVVMTDAIGALSSTVRTPAVIDPAFKAVRFGALYGAKHVKTEVQVSSDANFSVGCITITLPASTDPNPVWDLKNDVLAQYPIPEGTSVFWRVRYFADDGYVSAWSFTTGYTA